MSDQRESIKTHKDLEVWKQAMDMAEKAYFKTSTFPLHEQFGLTSQIRRSAISIPSNIAEGAARQTSKEFIHYLYISLGSLSEAETQLLIAKRLGYISDDVIFSDLESIRKMLLGLVKSLRTKQ
jgi:four helix bundle protein